MSAPRIAFIDWMKVLGMLLIVLGHTGAQGIWNPTPPFNFKQLGVAFFVFVMGFSLAGEKRPAWRAVYNRLFEVYLFGFLFAVVMSLITWLTIRDLAESNYLPLFLGINVLFDSFPANPTTWYIGTYLHLLLLWALVLRRVTVRPWMVLLGIASEIAVRALLIESAGNLVAYMALSNWFSVLLLGMWCGQNQEAATRPGKYAVVGELIGLLALLVLWPEVVRSISLHDGFPFARLSPALPGAPWLVTSASVSALYLTYTWLVFRITCRLPSLRLVQFLARNTLIVFIVHMPMIYALSPVYYPLVPQGGVRVLVNVVLYFFLPACGSEIIRRVACPTWWRDRLLERGASAWKAAPELGRTP